MHNWMSGKRELLFANLRLLFELLQMTGLLMGMGSFEPQWLVVSVAVMTLCILSYLYRTRMVLDVGDYVSPVWGCCGSWVQCDYLGTLDLRDWRRYCNPDVGTAHPTGFLSPYGILHR